MTQEPGAHAFQPAHAVPLFQQALARVGIQRQAVGKPPGQHAGIGHGNFYLERGEKSPEQIIAGVKNGFYVTELIGTGVNIVTGDYSRGAFGYWVKNGEIQHAVQEVTIAGNLADMFRQIVAVGADVINRGSKSSGSILIEQMAIAGQ